MKSKDNSEFERFKECEKQFKKSARQAKYKFEKKSFSEKNKKAFNSYLRTKTKPRAGVGSDFLANDSTTIQVSINQQVFGEPVSSVNISKR